MNNNQYSHYGIVSLILKPALDHIQTIKQTSLQPLSKAPERKRKTNKQTIKQTAVAAYVMRNIQCALRGMPRMYATRATAAGGHSQAGCGRLRVRITIANTIYRRSVR